MSKSILSLVLKKKWFDMIATGEKKEEYREDTMYWRRRLILPGDVADARFFDEVHFFLGYDRNRPFMRVECLKVTCGPFRPEWSEGGGEGYIIKLGKILEIQRWTDPRTLLFDMEGVESKDPDKFCRTCDHRQRHLYGNTIIQYCHARTSNRTQNGHLKIKCKTPACNLYKEAKTKQS